MAKIELIDNNPKNWVLTTNVFADLLSEYFFVKHLAKTDKAIDLDGEIYLRRDDFAKWEKISQGGTKEIKKRIGKIYSIYKKILSWAGKENKANPRLFSNKELLDWFLRFQRNFQKAWQIIDAPFYLESAISNRLKEEGLSAKEIALYFLSKKKSQAKKMVEEIEKTAAAEGIDMETVAGKLARNYFWLGQSFLGGKFLTKKYFLKELKRAKTTKTKRIEEATFPKLKINSPWKALAPEVSFLRNWRIETLNKSNALIRPYLEEMAKRIGLDYFDFIMLQPEEIKGALLGKKVLKKEIQERKRGYGVILDQKKEARVITGEDLKRIKIAFAQKLFKTKVIQGTPANPGKVRGKTVILNTREDFQKVKEGDIIVTKMTTPDFVPSLIKSKGLVTDIGGLTCHAAIISRELNIPCIIGTKIATQVLKDGDLVEVDADKGVIKMIKRA